MKYNINLEYKYKRKVWINMSDTAEILRLRVLLAFLQLERESCTVMNMSRMLGEEHYAISRTINGLEKEGLVSRTSPRKRNRGSGVDQILHGSVCLKMKCSVGLMHMPESTAIFTVLI